MRSAPRAAVAVLALVGAAACSGKDQDTDKADAATGGPAYVISSLVFDGNDTTSFISVLDSLAPQTIDYGRAREFSGTADVWVHEGAVFVAEGEARTITKFSVANGQLVEGQKIGFGSYGLTDFGFWLNTFVSPTKAYFLNGSSEYIVWNPSTMEITGTLALPALEARPGFKVFGGYADRAAVVRGGRLYQPFYWTDNSYFLFTPDSRIAVIDIATDKSVGLLEAPCPGLDFATQDPAGDIYFSSWVYAAGGALVLDQPATCVVKVSAGSDTASKAFAFPDVTGGRQGAALRSIGGGRALLSVLHGERVTLTDMSDPAEITFGPNWRFWTYDFAAGTASMIEPVTWNAGAQYSFDIDGKTFMLVAAGDYSATTIYDLGDGQNPLPVFDARGWAVRLFRVR